MNLAHIVPKFQPIAMQSVSDRIRFLDEPRWIGYASATVVLDTLVALLNKPKKPRMENLLLIGEPNNGKTTLINRFIDLHGQTGVTEDNEPSRPLLYCQAPPAAREKDFYICILDRFFAPYRPTDSVGALRAQVLHQVRSCHTRMLLVDEMHSLLAGGAREQRVIMNAIKFMCNELMIPVVCVGTRDALTVMRQDPQHVTRFDVLELPLWKLDGQFQTLVRSFESIMPLREPSNLHGPRMSSLLHVISGGNLGNLQRLLVQAAQDALKQGQECIDEANIRSKQWMQAKQGLRTRVA